MHRPHPLLVILLAFLCVSSATQAQQPSDAPNVIVILTDDQGCGDVGFMDNSELQTPNIDRLANQGTLLPSFYVSPVCAPTRASLLTGRYHQRTGVRGVIEGREFMVESETTIAELLSAHGYQTGIVGKWHLGENYPRVPRAQGFDTFVGFLQGSSPYFDVTLTRNGQPYPTKGYLTDVFTDEAIDFVERNRDHPYFLYLAYNAPHGPLQVPDEYVEPYKDLPERTAKIYGMMASVDENVGRLMNRLEALDLSEETLVLFTSDNGPLQHDTDRYNCGLRGHKYDVWEGGIRVPLIARWPTQIPSDGEVSQRTMHIDLLPTILDYAGVSVPDSVSIDGRSLRPLLSGGSTAGWPDRTLYMHYPDEGTLHEIMVEEREPAPFPDGVALDQRYKMVDGDQLFSLPSDRDESENLAGKNPDALQRLRSSYESFWHDVQDDRDSYPRTHVGHPQENPVRMTAHFARLSGGAAFQYKENPPRYRSLGVHSDLISRWNDDGAKATWRLEAQANASYEVSLRMRCRPEKASDALTVQVQSESDSTTGTPSAVCRSGDAWSVRKIGTLDLSEGDVDLTVSIPRMPVETHIEISHLVVQRLDVPLSRARPY